MMKRQSFKIKKNAILLRYLKKLNENLLSINLSSSGHRDGNNVFDSTA